MSDIEVPKSGSSRIRPTRPATTTAIGMSEYPSSLIRCMRRSSSAAMKTTATSFASSDGCTPRPPMANHRRALFTGGLNRTATRPSAERMSDVQMKDGCLYVR